LRLEAPENITFVFKAEMADIFDHEGFFALAAAVTARDSKAQNRFTAYVASQMDS
jgi:hypothetical protein